MAGSSLCCCVWLQPDPGLHATAPPTPQPLLLLLPLPLLLRGWYWTRDYNLACYDNPHFWLFLGVGLPGLFLFCIGVPIMSWLWLR